MEVLRLTAHDKNDHAVIECHGDIDPITSNWLGDMIDEKIGDGHIKIIICLDAVKYIDASGLGVLAQFHQHLEDADGKLCLVSPRGRVLRTLEILGLDQWFHLHPTVEHASDHLTLIPVSA